MPCPSLITMCVDVQDLLASSRHHPRVAHVALETLCPALIALVSDGLRPAVRTVFGKVKNSPWRVMEDSTCQGTGAEIVIISYEYELERTKVRARERTKIRVRYSLQRYECESVPRHEHERVPRYEHERVPRYQYDRVPRYQYDRIPRYEV